MHPVLPWHGRSTFLGHTRFPGGLVQPENGVCADDGRRNAVRFSVADPCTGRVRDRFPHSARPRSGSPWRRERELRLRPCACSQHLPPGRSRSRYRSPCPIPHRRSWSLPQWASTPPWHQLFAVLAILGGAVLVAVSEPAESRNATPGRIRRTITFALLAHVIFLFSVLAGQSASQEIGALQSAWVSRIGGSALVLPFLFFGGQGQPIIIAARLPLIAIDGAARCHGHVSALRRRPHRTA